MTTQTLERSTPEAQGIPSSALLAFVDAAERSGLELHSFMLLRHGAVVAEGWWKPYGPDSPHMLYSLSKSFTSTAAGLAIEAGLLSLDDTVISFFPEDVPETVSVNLAAMRVRHLLSMSAGHDQDTTGALHQQEDGNWVRAFLARPVEHEPGTHFVYNSGATYMVSAIVQKVTGQTLVEWLTPRLFEPLGIAHPVWEMDTQGKVCTGGWGLNITTEDIARFGQLYLQKGMWNGKRLVSEAWVDEATAFQVSNGDKPDSDWAQGYGYQFWRSRHGAYRGDGAFGQFCVVMPEQDAVIAMTGNVGEMQVPLTLVWEHLLPQMASAPLPADKVAQDQLRERLSRLAIAPPPEGKSATATAAQVSGKAYQFAENEQGLQTLRLDINDTQAFITLQDSKGTHKVQIGVGGEWKKGETTFLGGRLRRGTLPGGDGETDRVAASGAWTDEATFTARLCFYETPFTPTIICRFAGDTLHFELQGRIGFGPAERPVLEAHRV